LAVEAGERGIAVERHTWRTSREGVFAAGSVIRPHRHPAYAAAQGRDAARAVHVLLRGPGEEGGKRRFSSVIGSLLEGETGELLKEASPSPPVQPASDSLYSDGEARKESARCMHCDCRRKEDCGLRNLAEEFGAVQRRFAGKERVRLLRVTEHPEIILEPGKCIRCGLCLEAAARNPAVPGLCFKGKGIDMRVGTPFDISLKEALDTTGTDCANVCPTGAFSHRRRGQGEERH
jgi:ferredoxin